MTVKPYLTDDEIQEICQGLSAPSAQIRYMRREYKLAVHVKPNGRALVWRSEAERVLGAGRFGPNSNTGDRQGTQPNLPALEERWSLRRRHGTQAQG
jgi:hypothetical protein